MNTKKTTSLGFFALLLFIIAYFPVFRFLCGKWIDLLDYTYAFFAVPVIIYMVWQKWGSIKKSNDANLFGLAGIILTTILYLTCLNLKVFTLTSLLMVMMVVSAFVYLAGLRVLRVLVVPILLMILLIPIPNQIYVPLTLPLQLKVSQASEILVRLFDIPIYREGNILTIPGKVFEVIEACSGIRSLMALFSLSLMLGYFTLRRNLSILLLFAFSVPVALIVNIIRVLSMILAYHYFALDLIEGSAHTITSSVIFFLALALLYMLQRILESWETKKETKLIVLCIVLLVTCFGAYSKSTSRSISQGVPLKQSLGPVHSFQSFEDIVLEPQMIIMLDLDDHIFRNYQGPGGNVNLYIGYYLTTDKAYASHSPLTCFPSQGWEISDPIKQKLTVGDQTIHYAELTASIQEQNELILYWYQAGDQTTSSVTRNKYNALYNKIMRKPEKHAFIRVSVPFADSGKEAAEKTAHRFIKEFYPEFSSLIGSPPQISPQREVESRDIK